VMLPLDAPEQHIAVIGLPGSGKTNTVELLVDQLARKNKTAEFMALDAGSDPNFARHYCALMEATGRTVRVFPQQRFNAWPQADWRVVFNRIMKAVAFAETGAAKWFTDLSTVALARACRIGGTPPRSSKELFERLKYVRLRDEYGTAELAGLEPEHVQATFIRLMALYERTGSALDGNWSCGDVDAGYFGLDSLILGESVGVVAFMLLSHIANYVKHEKDPDRICVVVIDEFAALAGGMHNVAEFIEQVRKFGVYVIVASQTVAGMGTPQQAKRLMSTIGTVIVHATSEWEALSSLLSTKLMPDLTLQYEGGDGAEPDRVRQIERPAVKPEEMLSPPLGRAWLLRKASATQVQFAVPDRSDHKQFELPVPEELHLPLGLGEQDETGEEDSAPDFLSGEPKEEGFHRDDFEVPGSQKHDGKNTKPPPRDPDPASDHEPDSGGVDEARSEIPKLSDSGDQHDERPDDDAPPLDVEEEGDEQARTGEEDSAPGFLTKEPREKGSHHHEPDSEGLHEALSEAHEEFESGDRSDGSDEDALLLDVEEGGDEQAGSGEEGSAPDLMDLESHEAGFHRDGFEIPGHPGVEEDEPPPDGPDPT
ncbi:MAG: DUF87 domain-containing protein, partial [Actinomycetota bacterium]